MSFKSMKKDELVDLSIRRFLFNNTLPPLDSNEYDELFQKVKDDNLVEDLVDKLENNNTRGFEVVPNEHRVYPKVEIKKPHHGSEHSIAYDLYLPVAISNFKYNNMVATDICAYMQSNEGLFGVVRSSGGIKKGLMLSNTVAVVESDYYSNPDNYGNIHVALNSLDKKTVSLPSGERIVQVWFAPFLKADNYNTKTERVGGIGSSDKGDDK